MADDQFGFDLGDAPIGDQPLFDPDLIRADMNAILADARAVQAAGQWSERTFRYNRLVFPNMAKWLPEEEAAQLCFEFAQEMARIETLMAA